MQIKINDDFRITTDPYNVIVEERILVTPKSKDDNEAKEPYYDWKKYRYYPNLEIACTALIERHIKTKSEADSLQGILEEMRLLKQQIIDGVKEGEHEPS